MKIVEVQWNDSCALTEVWVSKRDLEEITLTTAECVTVGYVVQENEESISLAQSINDNQFGKIFTIPKGCITEILELEYYDPNRF